MALQGTLDTFSLPDVLKLLATTSKTGRLRIDGDRGQGSVWLRDGRVVDADADRAVDGAPTDEVVFELLRFGSGSFAFDSESHTPNAEHPDEVEDLLRRANALLSEWTELEAVVPSLDHRVSLTSELSSDEVTIDADRWRSVVAVAGGRSVGEVASSLGLSELNVSRAVRDLVELGVADVDRPEPIPEPSRLTDLPDLPSERPRRARLTVPAHTSAGHTGSPDARPGRRERESRAAVGAGSMSPAAVGAGSIFPSRRSTGETPRAGWRQSDRTSGPHPTVGPEGLPPSARATNGQGRPSGPGSRVPSLADATASARRAVGSRRRAPNGGRPASRSGRGRSAATPPSPRRRPPTRARFPLPRRPTGDAELPARTPGPARCQPAR